MRTRGRSSAMAAAAGDDDGGTRGHLTQLVAAVRKDRTATFESPPEKAALDSLRQLGPRAVPELTTALRDRDYNMRFLVELMQGTRGRRGGNFEEQARRAAARALGARGEQARPAIPALTAALKDPDAGVMQEAALALAGLGPDAKRTAVQGLTELIATGAPTRGNAVWAFAERLEVEPDMALMTALVRLLEDGDPNTQRGAVKALQAMGQREGGVAVLQEMLKSSDSSVRTRWSSTARSRRRRTRYPVWRSARMARHC